MARKLSRRAITEHIAQALLDGESKQKLIDQLAAYLIENRRTNELSLMVRDIQYFLAEKGQVSGTIVSAFELSEATRQSIETFVKAESGADAVELDTVIDPSVLGGVRLALPGKELDTTISRKITLLKTRYKKA
jgi:F-type H+-transporting ATPase subunit delta